MTELETAEDYDISEEQLARIQKWHEYFYDGARMTFNYNFMLFIASVIACLGLVSNSSTILIASMLISPIMGPVLGMAYGTTIRDWAMVRLSFRNECLSLLVCVIMGCIIAACTAWTDLANEWLSDEMLTRGTWQNFYIGLPVAFFSGLAAAVSVLDSQSSSLVGVAISASLLPPACNAGLIWVSYAFLTNDKLGGTGYTRDDLKDEFIEAGGVSLLLSVANIILIYIASVIAFRIKWKIKLREEKKQFWNDLRKAQDIYHKKRAAASAADSDLMMAAVNASDSGESDIENQIKETSA